MSQTHLTPIQLNGPSIMEQTGNTPPQGPVKGGPPTPPDADLKSRIRLQPGGPGKERLLTNLETRSAPQGPGKEGGGQSKTATETTRELKDPLLSSVQAFLKDHKTAPDKAVQDGAAQANSLLLKAEKAKELAIDMLMARKGSLSAPFSGYGREDMAKHFDSAPLAKLTAAERQLIVQLRAAHYESMESLTGMADRLDAGKADISKAYKEQLQKILNAATERFTQYVNKLPEAMSPQKTQLLALHESVKKGEMGNLNFLSDLVNYNRTEKIRGHHLLCITDPIESLMIGLLALNREVRLLDAGGKGALVRDTVHKLAVYDNELAARQFSPDFASLGKGEDQFLSKMDKGLQVLNMLADPNIRKDASNHPLNKNYVSILDSAPPAARELTKAVRDEQLTAILKKVVSQPVTAEKTLKGNEAKQLAASVLWKFDTTLRNDFQARYLTGLVSHPEKYFKKAVDDLPLGYCDKRRLVKNMLAARSKHFIKLSHLGGTVGEGGFGAVRSLTVNGRDALVKLAKPGQTDQQAFLRELLVQSSFQDNPNIPKILGLGVMPGEKAGRGENLRIVMERVPGKDLASYVLTPEVDRVKDELLSKMPAADRGRVAVHLFKGAVNALAGLHAAGYAHNDVKSANIMLDSHSLEARLIDFGLGDRVGTLPSAQNAYADPHAQRTSLASDVYALALTIMEVVTGGTNTNEGGQAAFIKTMRDNPVWRTPELVPLKNMLELCLQPDQTARPTTAQLQAVIRGEAQALPSPHSGGANKAGLETLRAVLGPGAALDNGREVLAAKMK